MNSASSNRYTQIDLAMCKMEPPEPQRGEADDSIGGITKRASAEAFSKRSEILTTKAAEQATMGPAHLRLPIALNSGLRAFEYIETKQDSPWKYYEQIYQLRFGVGDWVTLAQDRSSLTSRSANRKRKDPLSNLVIVKKFPNSESQGRLRNFATIRHAKFVSPLAYFAFAGDVYVVSEYMSISLSYIAGNPYVNEIRLAAIISQVQHFSCDAQSAC